MVGAVDMLRPQKGPVRKSRLVCIVDEQSVLGALNDPKGENSNLAFSAYHHSLIEHLSRKIPSYLLISYL